MPETDALKSLSLVGKHYRPGESSTDAMGRFLYQKVTGKEPDKETKTVLSYLVHWLIGLGMSGVYGARRGRAGLLDVSGGMKLGTGLWLLGDEMLAPMMGFTSGPTAYPPELHVHGWGAHIAYGLASAVTTQILHRIL